MYICWRYRKGAVLHMRKTKSPSTELDADVGPTKKSVRPGSACGSLSTLLSLPQCHAGLSKIHSTLASIDQSPVSLRATYNPHHGIPSTIVTASYVTQGRVQQCFSIAARYRTMHSIIPGRESFSLNMSF